jgi:membrane protease YdiL (CAAX protease family)
MAVLARILVALYLFGNINFVLARGISNFATRYFLGNHVDLVEALVRAVLSIAVAAIIFPSSLRRGIKFDGRARAWVVASALMTLCVLAVQVALALGVDAVVYPHVPTFTQLTYVLLSSLAAAITEELLCRLIALDQARRVIGIYAAFVFQTLLFVFIHVGELGFGYVRVLMLVVGGVFFAAIYLKSGSLLAAGFAHLTYNVGVKVIFGANSYGSQIFPQVVGGNLSKTVSITAGAIALLICSLVIILRGCRRSSVAHGASL